MKTTFLGATGTVTGSKYLIEHLDKKILIDCGLFQGHKELRLRNWADLPVNPASIDAVILTHAHIDHSGYIPRLVKQGFKGKVYCSNATLELCKILLPDSGYLQEDDARRANKYGYSKHKEALPLYSKDEAIGSLNHFQKVDFGQSVHIDNLLSFTLNRSGHILGSAFVVLSDGNKTITFSGDLGRQYDPIMEAPAELQQTDYLILESTYGDRLHALGNPLKDIAKIIKTTAAKGGTIVIPAFAIGRAQEILHYIYKAKESGMIPDIPVFLDSPMAINATELLCKFNNEHKLDKDLCANVCDVARYARTSEESQKLDNYPMPIIIISASGMATGGRVLHHLKKFIDNPKNTILFAGFQASGTRGDKIVRGDKEIKIHGVIYNVKARIEKLDNISAHADYYEILEWLGSLEKAPKKIFLTHGEPSASMALKIRIEEELGWNAVIPKYLESETL